MADEARAAAGGMDDGFTRKMMNELADAFDRLAKAAAEREKKKKRGFNRR